MMKEIANKKIDLFSSFPLTETTNVYLGSLKVRQTIKKEVLLLWTSGQADPKAD